MGNGVGTDCESGPWAGGGQRGKRRDNCNRITIKNKKYCNLFKEMKINNELQTIKI